ncbi:MAG: hypothetical protein ACKO6K_11590, partial [Chitinophagaceae bacterium]
VTGVHHIPQLGSSNTIIIIGGTVVRVDGQSLFGLGNLQKPLPRPKRLCPSTRTTVPPIIIMVLLLPSWGMW